jgi:hypothetical protein
MQLWNWLLDNAGVSKEPGPLCYFQRSVMAVRNPHHLRHFQLNVVTAPEKSATFTFTLGGPNISKPRFDVALEESRYG